MVIVEFLDKETLNNMIGTMAIKPRKVIFLGDNSMINQRKIKYQRVVDRLGIGTELEFQSVNKRSVDDIIDALVDIVESEDDEITFDLNGGDDLVLLAMGIVFQSYKGERHINMHRFNIGSGNLIDCDGDNEVPQYEIPRLSVEDSLALYGGSLMPYHNGKGTFPWDFNDDFNSDIDVLWNICSEDPKLWNLQITTLGVFSKGKSTEQQGVSVRAKVSYIKALMGSNSSYYKWDRDMIKRFINLGYILDYRVDDDYCSFRFKNEQIKKCLTKAGTILELKVYQVLKSVQSARNHEPFFNDAVIGAYIDWDGENIYDAEVENEIDVLVMKGVTPIFISCKNGRVDMDELYKLNTVSQRFGGTYSKKYLVVTNYGESSGEENNPELKDGFRKHIKNVKSRAEDMGISIVEGVHLDSDSSFRGKMREIVS